jgi:hypothetical protein
MQPIGGYGTGYIPDGPDINDLVIAASPSHALNPPASTNNRAHIHEVENQLHINSCVGNGMSTQFDWARQRAGLPPLDPSRLMIYYGARARDGWPTQDIGCTPRNAIKALVEDGVCAEDVWPYDPGRVNVRPAQAAYDLAQHSQLLTYARPVQSEAQFKAILAEEHLIGFGHGIYESFTRVGRDGRVPTPQPGERLLGLHWEVLIDYRPGPQGTEWVVLNSYDTTWGDGGYGYWQSSYLFNPQLVMDPWVLYTVEPGEQPPPPPPPPPDDPWQEYPVGSGIAAKMRQYGDVPCSPEGELFDNRGFDLLIRVATGWPSGRTYRWIVSKDVCVVDPPPSR